MWLLVLRKVGSCGAVIRGIVKLPFDTICHALWIVSHVLRLSFVVGKESLKINMSAASQPATKETFITSGHKVSCLYFCLKLFCAHFAGESLTFVKL